MAPHLPRAQRVRLRLRLLLGIVPFRVGAKLRAPQA